MCRLLCLECEVWTISDDAGVSANEIGLSR